MFLKLIALPKEEDKIGLIKEIKPLVVDLYPNSYNTTDNNILGLLKLINEHEFKNFIDNILIYKNGTGNNQYIIVHFRSNDNTIEKTITISHDCFCEFLYDAVFMTLVMLADNVREIIDDKKPQNGITIDKIIDHFILFLRILLDQNNLDKLDKHFPYILKKMKTTLESTKGNQKENIENYINKLQNIKDSKKTDKEKAQDLNNLLSENFSLQQYILLGGIGAGALAIIKGTNTDNQKMNTSEPKQTENTEISK